MKPVQSMIYTYKPMEKWEKIKAKQRIIKSYDIHWRNIELISQFVSRTGCIRSRFVTCLPINQHKKMQRAIKTARGMMVFPHYGQLTINMRRNITSLEEDVNDLGKKQINLDTGHIYMKRGRSSDYVRYKEHLKNDPDNKYSQMMEEGKHYKLWVDTLKQENNDKDFENNAKAEAYARELKKKQLVAEGINLNKEDSIHVTELDKRLGVRRMKPTAIPK